LRGRLVVALVARIWLDALVHGVYMVFKMRLHGKGLHTELALMRTLA
jgi:hypothetical protein